MGRWSHVPYFEALVNGVFGLPKFGKDCMWLTS